MAVQRRLGLLSQRRTGTPADHRPHPRADRPYLSADPHAHDGGQPTTGRLRACGSAAWEGATQHAAALSVVAAVRASVGSDWAVAIASEAGAAAATAITTIAHSGRSNR